MMSGERRDRYGRRVSLVAACAAALVGSLSTSARAEGGSAPSVEPFFGSFGTTMKIEVPRYHGLEPGLQLAYNSQGRDSQVGVGWQLGGFPSIERASASRGAPAYAASDSFVLDGMELVPCTTFGGTHCSKIQSYQRITWDAANNAWHVWQKDGVRLDFTPVFSTSKGTFRWGVTSAADPVGNTVSYGWWCDASSDCYPSTVNYNGTSVALYWESRADVSTFATGAGLGRTNYRLKTIDVKTSGTRVRSYALAYGTSPSSWRSMLSSVQMYGRDASVDGSGAVTGGTSYPATRMSYSGSAAAVGVSSQWSAPAGNFDASRCRGGLVSGDFSGDGNADFACLYDYGNASTGLWVWTSNGAGLSLSRPWFAAAGNFDANRCVGGLKAADYNGQLTKV